MDLGTPLIGSFAPLCLLCTLQNMCRIYSFALRTFVIRSLHCSALCRIERTAPMHWGKALNEFHAYLILASLIFAYPWPSDHICLCNPDQTIRTSDRSGIAAAMLHQTFWHWLSIFPKYPGITQKTQERRLRNIVLCPKHCNCDREEG